MMFSKKMPIYILLNEVKFSNVLVQASNIAIPLEKL